MSKGNELPDYLFPEGKKVKHRKRTKTGVESEAKKVNWRVCLLQWHTWMILSIHNKSHSIFTTDTNPSLQ